MKQVRDWIFTIPTVAAFGLTLGVFHLIGLCALPFGQPFEGIPDAQLDFDRRATRGAGIDLESIERFLALVAATPASEAIDEAVARRRTDIRE